MSASQAPEFAEPEAGGKTHHRLLKIQRAGRGFRPVFLALALLLPVSICAYWLLQPVLPHAMRATTHAAYFVAQEPGLGIRLAALLVNLPAALMGAGAAWSLARLMGLYGAGRVFTRETVRCFVLVGRFLLLGTLAHIPARPMLSVALTWSNPPGQKALALTFGSADLMGLVAGGVVLLMARVMEEGRALDEDRRLTV